LTFFLDNMLPPALATILKMLEYDVIHLREHFAADTKDEEWIPVVGKKRWAILTVDNRIANSRATQEILRAANTVAVFLFPSFQKMNRDDQVAWTVKHFAEIKKRAESTAMGTNLLVRQNGRIERLK
jgi:hypothetical protein